MALTLNNIKSWSHAISTIDNFGRHAGSKINFNKTECILLATLKDQYETVEILNISKHVRKCLGIYLGHDQTEYYIKKSIYWHRKTIWIMEEKKINCSW